MEYDVERANEKTGELIDLAKEAILTYWKSVGLKPSPGDALEAATKVISNFTEVTPPRKGPRVLESITLRPGARGGGHSVKPGNIFLNLQKLVTTLAASSLTVMGTVAVPWTAPLAAIVIWNSVWSNLKVELTEREAAILWTMWVNRDDDRCVADVDLLDKVNSGLRAYGRSSISRQELDDALETLKKMGCIEWSESDPPKWWLRESMQVSYN